MSDQLDNLKKRYEMNHDIPIHCNTMCGDGKTTHWKLDYNIVDIIEVYRCSAPFHPESIYDGNWRLEGNELIIDPPILYNELVQVDYWARFVDAPDA